jgi:DNA-binding transcriptional LysR family regulator
MIFHVLMIELNVSKTATKLHLSQPALSNALNRLRSEFKDDLFVRSSKGMVPTPKALALKQPISKIIEQSFEIYGERTFNPKDFAGRFTVATTDYVEHLLLPKLLPYFAEKAPQMTTLFRPTLGILPKLELEQGQYDLAIAGFFGALPEGFHQELLFEDNYSCLVRSNHPTVPKKLTLKTYLELEHLLVSPQGDLQGVMDRVLAKNGLKRKIVAGVTSFSIPPTIIAESDYVVTLPTRIAKSFAKTYSLQIHSPPVDLPEIKIVQVWHQRTQTSSLHKWLRSKVARLAR